jgi:predicted Fe-S protein YdhL (DUF1289 family)|tara:strand:+ start:234 stop:389 length:156 start_codon:yes stop_codon:yes gene_type:complete
MIKSPCKSVCELDPNTNLCSGCGRTKDEITNWIHYNDEEREKIIKKVDKKG